MKRATNWVLYLENRGHHITMDGSYYLCIKCNSRFDEDGEGILYTRRYRISDGWTYGDPNCTGLFCHQLTYTPRQITGWWLKRFRRHGHEPIYKLKRIDSKLYVMHFMCESCGYQKIVDNYNAISSINHMSCSEIAIESVLT